MCHCQTFYCGEGQLSKDNYFPDSKVLLICRHNQVEVSRQASQLKDMVTLKRGLSVIFSLFVLFPALWLAALASKPSQIQTLRLRSGLSFGVYKIKQSKPKKTSRYRYYYRHISPDITVVILESAFFARQLLHQNLFVISFSLPLFFFHPWSSLLHY